MRRIAIITAGMIGAAILGGPPVQADPGTATHVDSLSAAVSGSNVQISGGATFVDVPVDVLTDPDPARVPLIGANVTKGTLSRPVGTNKNTSFVTMTFDIGDPNPGFPNGSFPGMVFLLPLMVDGSNSGLFLMAGAAGGLPDADANPKFSVMQLGSGGFSTVARVEGSMGGGKLEWKIPEGALGAKAGSLIEQAPSGAGTAPSQVRVGLHEIVYCCTTADWIEQYVLGTEYLVPGARVTVGIAPAGTLPEDVPLTKAATIPNWTTGAFNTTLAKPAAGDYVVVAQACYTGADCVRASTDITVA